MLDQQRFAGTCADRVTASNRIQAKAGFSESTFNGISTYQIDYIKEASEKP